MFSVREKRMISDGVQELLRSTGHPELPSGEITFSLHVVGAESWSWADIRNNGAISDPSVNPHNEKQDEAHEDNLDQQREEHGREHYEEEEK